VIKILADEEIKVLKMYDDIDVEKVKDDNYLPEEMRRSKSPKATNPQLTTNVLKAKLSSKIIYKIFNKKVIVITKIN